MPKKVAKRKEKPAAVESFQIPLEVNVQILSGFPNLYLEVAKSRTETGREIRCAVSINGDALYVLGGQRQYVVPTMPLLQSLLTEIFYRYPEKNTRGTQP